jgi:hypothetical protein
MKQGAELVPDLARILRSLLGALRHESLDERIEGLGDARVTRCDTRGRTLLGELRRQDCANARARPARLADEGLPHHDPEREQIGGV